MKFFLTLLIPFFSLTFLASQTLEIEQELYSGYYEINDLSVNFSSEDFSITKNGNVIFTEILKGKKNFRTSAGQNYFLVANYEFSNEKTAYLIEVRVFNQNGEMVLSYKFQADFDLPHPLISINDQGILALFDPLSFKVKLISDEFTHEIELEKDIPFEMEKASFMEMNNAFLYVLTSERALDITENASNVKLYKIGLSDLSIDKKEIDYNTPTLLKLVDDNLFVSGVKFESYKPIGKTIKYDLQLNELAANDKIIEKIIADGENIYAKYFNTLYELNEDLKAVNELTLPNNERITDIKSFEDKIVVATNNFGKNFLYLFSKNLNIDFKLTLYIFDNNNVKDLSISGNHIVIQNESKSVIIKANRN